MSKTKQKIRQSIAKRFKITKTGKVLHRSSFSRHLRSNKSKSQKRKYNIMDPLKPRLARKIKKLLGV